MFLKIKTIILAMNNSQNILNCQFVWLIVIKLWIIDCDENILIAFVDRTESTILVQFHWLLLWSESCM